MKRTIKNPRSPGKNVPKTVVLRPYQVAHISSQRESLKKHGLTTDSSKQGSGKSFFIIHHAQTWIRERKKECGTSESVELLMIVPPISVVMWTNLTREYGVNAIVYSYTELRDGKTPYLAREGNEYTILPAYLELVKNGVLLGIDEIHHVSGNSRQARACVELTRALAEARSKCASIFSCVSLLSNTPKGEKDGIPGLLKLMGIMTSDKLLKPRVKGRKAWLGFEELYNWCLAADSEKTTAILGRYVTINSSNVLNWTLMLYEAVLAPELTTNVPVTFNNSKVVYTVEKLDREKFKDVASDIMPLEKALAIYDNGEKLPPVGSINLNPTFIAFDKQKAINMVTKYKRYLEDEQCKVALYVRYRETIKFLKEAFSEYDPLVLSGDGPSSKKKRNEYREDVRRKFQEPNGKYRVLIAHPKVGGESLSFDDQDGQWPRRVCITSSYHTTETKQIIGRFDRESTKSEATVEIYAFDGFKEEDNVFKRNQEKEAVSEILKGRKTEDDLLFKKRVSVLQGVCRVHVPSQMS